MINAFPPVIGHMPHTLILGSIPGIASLNARQYYAHPRNAFWSIMGNLIGFDPTVDYPDRCLALTNAGYALWDTLAQCQRSGSLDSAIDKYSEIANPIPELIAQYPSIKRILCNGSKSRKSLHRHLASQLPKNINIIQLPSTSPANARLTFAEKQALWAAGITHD